jgi:hypothetical protein
VVSSTVPVTSYVFAPVANTAPLRAKLAAAIKLSAVLVFIPEFNARAGYQRKLFDAWQTSRKRCAVLAAASTYLLGSVVDTTTATTAEAATRVNAWGSPSFRCNVSTFND